MNSNDPSSSILQRAVQGDRSALEALLERFTPALRRGVEREAPARFKSVLSTDDVLQQTFVDAFRDISRFGGASESAFERWLASIAHRNLLDAVRSLEAEKRGGKRARLSFAPETSCMALLDVLATGSRPSQVFSRQEAVQALRRAVSLLPADYRRCVEAFDLEGRPMEEVAAELGRAKGACYMIRARAHRMLREMLGKTSNFF